MTEFKQIIGRGTRVFEGKDFFTIIDFVGATNLFYDDAWDGLPEEIEDPKEPTEPSTVGEPKPPYGDPEPPVTEPVEVKEKVTIDIKGRKLKVIDIETTYVGADGIPLRTDEFLEFLLGVLNTLYHDETKLREIWSDPTTREELLQKLREMHIDETQLNDLKQMFEAEESDIYDVLAHLSFNLDIKTRSERAFAVHYRKYIEKYHNDKVKEFLDFILERYEKFGIKEIKSDNLSTLISASGMDMRDIKEAFTVDGTNVRDGYFGLQKEIYR